MQQYTYTWDIEPYIHKIYDMAHSLFMYYNETKKIEDIRVIIM